MIPLVQRYSDDHKFAQETAAFILKRAKRAVKERGEFTLVLSGGKTPKLIYEYFAKSPFKKEMPWENIHMFWGDERCVPYDHADSNYAMARDAFLLNVPLCLGNIHRIPADEGPPHKMAVQYEEALRGFFKDAKFPMFDLILLGIGEDGHTASLFPGDNALKEDKRWVVEVKKPIGEPAYPRITLTLPVINNASCILFLVSGKKKMKVMDEILDNQDAVKEKYPAARVRSEQLLWYALEK